MKDLFEIDSSTFDSMGEWVDGGILKHKERLHNYHELTLLCSLCLFNKSVSLTANEE